MFYYFIYSIMKYFIKKCFIYTINSIDLLKNCLTKKYFLKKMLVFLNK